ncbi:MAG: hypothetical protein ACOC2W_04180 [bacterium]
MKRLVKKALMNIEVLEGTIEQLGNQGRDILKLMEEYKFKLEQAARITTNDQGLTQKIIQKKKLVDNAAGQIYSIVFDIENIDITKAYEEQQLNTKPSVDNNEQIDGPKTPPPTDAPMPNNVNQEEFDDENDIVDDLELIDEEIEEIIEDVDVDNEEETKEENE